jgi:hypothetical protein
MSNVNIENLLYDAIGESFENYHREDLGSENRKAACSETIQLFDRAIELERIEVERKEKEAARKSEELIKERQMKAEKRKMVSDIAINVATTVAGMVFTGFMVHYSMKFEKTDTMTSTAGREYVRRGVSWIFKK